MTDKGIRQIICGANHTFILKNNGELRVFGDNKYGQLGLNDRNTRRRAILLAINENIKIINSTTIKKIIWQNPGTFSTLSEKRKNEIIGFLLVCYYYKKVHKINMVKYMKNMIIDLLF